MKLPCEYAVIWAIAVPACSVPAATYFRRSWARGERVVCFEVAVSASCQALVMSRGSKRKCPACGRESLARIVYGLVAVDEYSGEAASGHVVFGGCCVSDDDPDQQCVECGTFVWDDGRVTEARLMAGESGD